MTRLTATLILLLTVACIAVPVAADAAEPEGLTGLTAEFTAELCMGEDGPVLPLAGELAYSAGRLRVSITQNLTLEEYIALVDYEAGIFILLFPDTLNGKQYKLADFDHLDGFARIREVLAGQPPAIPGGWEQADHGLVELDGTECRHRSAARDELSVHWWTGPEGLPVKARLAKAGLEVTIIISAHDPDAAIDPALFTVPDDFTVSLSEENLPGALPSL